MSIGYRLTLAFIFAIALLSSSVSLRAQTPVTDDEVKYKTYNKFFENREPNPELAYEAAKDYMRLYGKENDDYTRYLKQWMAAFEEDARERKLTAERADREQQLLGALTQNRFADAYGRAKQVLSDDPNNVKVLIALGYAAFVASTETRNEGFNNDASNYARRAIQLLESGKAPDTWSPFKNKNDVSASLHYALGFYFLKTKPDEAIVNLIKATQFDSDRRTSPSTYYYLALAYQNGPYKKLSDEYTARYLNKPETPESKAALENLNKVVDRLVDALARAVALAGNNPQHQKAKSEWMVSLTQFYKFRHDNSDAGLNQFIAGVLAQPLPQP